MNKILSKWKGVLLGTLIVVCICSCGNDTAYYVDSESEGSTTQQEETSEQVETSDSQEKGIYVYVCGQIVSPGVYVLPQGSRICDLFQLAGGFTKDAATDYWNQARLLTDGEMIYVPTVEEVKDRVLENNTTSDTDDSDKVNINTASKEELMTLPGIGEARALAIIAYRKENGPFTSVEELKEVEGIKDGVFSKMKDYIEIN